MNAKECAEYNCMTDQSSKNPAAVALGRLGGCVRSAAKAKAARLNGRKGGRPKKAKPDA